MGGRGRGSALSKVAHPVVGSLVHKGQRDLCPLPTFHAMLEGIKGVVVVVVVVRWWGGGVVGRWGVGVVGWWGVVGNKPCTCRFYPASRYILCILSCCFTLPHLQSQAEKDRWIDLTVELGR